MNYVDAALEPQARTQAIKLHGADAFEGMRRAGRLAAEALDHVVPMVVPGATTAAIDRAAFDFIVERGGVPACLGYRGYGHVSCTSVNHVVCHGIPSSKPLKEGDIVNIDITAIVDGWHGDTSRMFGVGRINRRAERLIDITYECLMRGIEVARPGNTVGDIGHAIESFAHKNRCGVVEDFCGHGLGRLFHDSPNILHYGAPGPLEELRPGMFFTIEPMINLGKPTVKILSDGWTAVTRDKKLSAQFEHSIGITESGAEIFTASPAGLHKPPYG